MLDPRAMPKQKPVSPNFSSGPCKKRPGWSLNQLDNALIGRSHRSQAGKAKLLEVITLSKKILKIPKEYKVAIVPGSDTGAMEMAMWSLLGPRAVDVFVWENFSQIWLTDIVQELKLKNVREFISEYGKIPDLEKTDPNHDIVFAWNGTSSGVKVPNGNWIDDNRTGLTICDATSAAFAMHLPWDKLDVTTWSWQKTLGGEGAHGMIALSPRAITRLTDHTPTWPMPKLFRMVSKGQVTDKLFEGETINTPSLLTVEDALDGLRWAEEIGGLTALTKRCTDNLSTFTKWVEKSTWCKFLAEDYNIRSESSVCLKITSPDIDPALYPELAKTITQKMQDANIALDCGAYRTAPAGFRFWSGATIEQKDITIALQWLDYFYNETINNLK
ncbi:phosphoserine transaminase [Acetobacter fabarum]|uniref:phosphoserine transaminase n=1 Tax=Acetobacter fabarum TaxID=483199 RepID=UPI0033A48200